MPAGVTGNFASGVFTLSGSPTVAGIFSYSVTTTGGCSPASSLNGSITVNTLPTLTLTSAATTTNQTHCINTSVNNITYTIGGTATGASVSGLPTGLTGTFFKGVFTISGTPTVAGTYTYTATTTGGCAPASSLSGSIIVTPVPTLNLTSGTPTTNQTLCINTSIVNVTYSIGGSGTGASVSSLPAGLTGNFASGVFTISGTPTVAGTYNYTVTTTGGCSPTSSLNGSITITPLPTLNLTSAAATTNQTHCINTSVTNITYSIGGTGTGASVSGLPTGVNGNFISGVFTISGTPTVAGTFSYIVTTTGGCSPASNLNGSIIVTPLPTLNLTSAPATTSQALCINTAITNITYSIGGTGTGASVSGLPAGVTGTFASGAFTISGTPTVAGTFTYIVTTIGGCAPASNLNGNITITPLPTLALTSAASTTNQSICINTSISNINYSIGGSGTGASIIGLPTGVTSNFASGVFTISGIPSVAGTFSYTVTTTGGCAPAPSLSGSISVKPLPTVTATPSSQTICSGNAINTIVFSGTIPSTTYNWTRDNNTNVTGINANGIGNISGTLNNTTTSPILVTFTITPTVNGCSGTPITATVNVQAYYNSGAVTTSEPTVNPAVNLITVCHSASGTLYLSGYSGNIIRWESSTTGGSSWATIPNTATTYNYTTILQTTIFRAVIQNEDPSCPQIYSTTAMVNVIPNIKPTPVSATPSTICNGDSSILYSQSGYSTSQNIATGGAFSNSNPQGWLVDGCGNCLSAGSSNTNPGPFQLSATNGGTYSGVNYTSVGKFAIANGNITSVLQTPVFNTLGLSTASLDFTHSYKLTAGASARVEISVDGGATYTTILAQYDGVSTQAPYDLSTSININLNAYLGQSNLKIRFNYIGKVGSSWGIDNIKIPEAPAGVLTSQWVDTSTNVIISNTNTTSATVSPTVTTTYAVTSYLNGCTSYGPEGTTYVTVTVNKRPTASIGVSQTICYNGTASFGIALTGSAPWSLTYTNGTTPTTITNINTNPYVFSVTGLIANKMYSITGLSDSKCTAKPEDYVGSATVTVLNGTQGLWTGNKSTDWFDCLNWAGGLPSNTVNAVIPNGVSKMPIIDITSPFAGVYNATAKAMDLSIANGASVTMNANSNLEISRDWKNSGNFTPGTGTVTFNGATLNQVQTINLGIKTQENFYNLNLNTSNNAKGISVVDGFELDVSNIVSLLSGDLRLTGEAQLLQGGVVANPTTGTGKLLRDQQGLKNSFRYDYWSSPVSNNNSNYFISGVIRDGTDVTTNPFNPNAITFGDGAFFADGVATNPIKISNRWLYKYTAISNSYFSWQYIGNTGTLRIGEGFTMKGTDGTVSNLASQNYVFVGKPNNGTISLTISPSQSYLVGNPYPSALNATEFIKDNIKDGGRATSNIFNGALYFWDHYGGKSHYLAEYIGGYATYSLMGGVVATANDPLNINDGSNGSKVPTNYIPVGQGFFIGTNLDPSLTTNNPRLSGPITGGSIVFRNSQRTFKTESAGGSIFFRTNPGKVSAATENDDRPKIRLKFNSSSGIRRQLLVGADSNTSNLFDLGYDAPLIDKNKNDMYWEFSNNEFVIQAVPDFNVDQIIPLGLKISDLGISRIKIDSLEQVPNDTKIYLFDNVTGIYQDLKQNDFTISLPVGEYKNRFSLRFQENTLSVNDTDLNTGLIVFYSNKTALLNIINNRNDTTVNSVSLYTILGQFIEKWDVENFEQKNIQIPIKNWSSEVYITKINTSKGVINKKIILK